MSPADTQASHERAELESILHSGIFARAPNLANFLKYVCEKYFEGQGHNIKEYCIAVEALNRQQDFDPKHDSIVRVEAHRLRKRLAEFYADAGAGHPVQIEIPNGQYSPKFRHVTGVVRTSLQATVLLDPPQTDTEGPRALQTVRPRFSRQGAYWVVGLGVALGLLVFGLARTPHSAAIPASPEKWRGSYEDPIPGEFRFLAGYHGEPYTDRQGRFWQPDAYFDGGISVSLSDGQAIQGLPDAKFAKSRREGTFRYSIPARQGAYELHFHFITDAARGDLYDPARLASFQISVNGHPIFNGFDPVSEAGGFGRLHSRVIRDVSPAEDGKIHLAFQPIVTNAFVNAIEVLSSEPGRVRPVRIVAAKSSVVDSDGAVWWADQDAVGGVLVERHDSIQDARFKMLFNGEHYGNFSYHIPMPPGRYRVKLYFAETFFGSKLPNAVSPVGARLFNVFGNGVALLRDFDVARDAGGPNRAIVKVFENMEPNAQGNIVLDFVPLRNYAEVNAIEVSQMN